MILVIIALLVVGSGCSDDSDDGTSADDPAADNGQVDDGDVDDGDVDDGEAPAGDGTLSTAGLKDYLDTEHPDEGFASEVSLVSGGEGMVLVGTQTSFFEPDEALAFCEAVSAYVYEVVGEDPGTAIELESTSGTTVAERPSADGDCAAG
jgi:hypothetical protein